jgi:hypothetical protein
MKIKHMKDYERNKLANEDLSKISSTTNHENHYKLISLSQGDFGDDSPKVPASEANTTKINLHRKGGL